MRKNSNKSGRSSRDSAKNIKANPDPIIPFGGEGETLDGALPDETSKPLEAGLTPGENDNLIGSDVNFKGSENEPQLTKIHGSAHEGTGTSISSQIQKIIAKELMTPGNKKNIDLQSVPMKEYLEHTVLPIVHQGLMAVARERPDSPIEYMAAYFLKHKSKYQLSYDPELEIPPMQTNAQPTPDSQQPLTGKTTPKRASADMNLSQEVPENKLNVV